jgi:HSP20 family protein
MMHRRGEPYSLFPFSTDEFFQLSPFQLMRHFTEEMDRMWSGFGRGRTSEESMAWRPTVDVMERNGKLQVRAELPGLSEKDVKVSIENDTLILQGERKREEEKEEGGWYRSERSYGSFYRAIPLPEGAETDKANARFQNGLLEIEMPVPKTQHQARQIPISTTAAAQSTQPTASQSAEKTSKAGGA